MKIYIVIIGGHIKLFSDRQTAVKEMKEWGDSARLYVAELKLIA